MSVNRLNAYRQTSVKTASQGRLIVMLYDEAIKQMDIAKDELSKDKKKFDTIHNAISKTQDIITELMASLDFEKGGDISQNLYNLYMFFNRELVQANINKDIQPIDNVRRFMSDLREAWVAIEGTAVNQNPAGNSGVEYSGMMGNPSAEKYTESLLNKLYSLYGEYINELQIMKTQLEQSPVGVLETFINIEQHRFQQISSIEKVLNTHFSGCSQSFQKGAEAKLMSYRIKALRNSREVRSTLNSQMKKIKTELSSIRLPGRAKNYRQESVPVLIDIQT